MSSRSAARGSAAASSIRLTSRTSKAVATSRASPSRCFLFCRGSRAARSAPIAAATVAIPPIRKPPQARRIPFNHRKVQRTRKSDRWQDDGGVDHRVFVVRVVRQVFENRLPNPALRPPAEPRMDRFWVAKPLGQVPPRNAGPIAIKHGLHEQPVVFRRHADMALPPWQKILNAVPLVVAKGVASHRQLRIALAAHEAGATLSGNPPIEDRP